MCKIYTLKYAKKLSNVTIMLINLLKKGVFDNINLTLRKINYFEIYTQLLEK